MRKPRPTCTYADCERPHLAKGLCSLHYQRQQHGYDMDGIFYVPKVCTANNCDRIGDKGRGYCGMHYQRYMNGNDLDMVGVVFDHPETCTYAGCENTYKTKGYCAFHYTRSRQGVPLNKGPRGDHPDTCTHGGCGKPYHLGGYCSVHYGRSQRGKDMDDPGWDQMPGAQRRTSQGYIRRKAPRGHPSYSTGSSGWPFEHQLVMEEFLGRPLTESENVHHKNGVRDDNRITNLELWSTAQPEGQRISDKLQWAAEIIEKYSRSRTYTFWDGAESA